MTRARHKYIGMDILRLMEKLRPKTLLLLALALALLLLIIRGCVMSRGSETPQGVRSDSGVTLSVYDHREDAVSQMELEDYVLHVVAGEMPAAFELEALKAQAVAARTFTVRRMAEFGGSPCERADICTDSSCCQAFKSDDRMKIDWGKDYAKKLARVAQAVEETAGLVAVYDGEPIEALYHSTSGGHTENAENVFGGARPYLVSVPSPGEESAPRFTGELTMTRRAFAKKLNKECKANLSARRLHRQVEIKSRYASGRVEEVCLGEATLTGRELRKLLDLNSADFSFEFTDSEVLITTRGYGHGVGMSQYGANAMAAAGAAFGDILAHYYTGIVLAQVNTLAK